MPRPPAKATTPNRNQPTHNKGQANTPKQPTNAKATNAEPKVTCSFCGRQGHGERARTAIRRLQCPAFGSTCSACSKPNHYASLCWQNSERESAIRESVADMTEGTPPHQTWDSSTGSWVKRRSPPQPNLDVLVSTHQEDYKTHGNTLRREKRNLATITGAFHQAAEWLQICATDGITLNPRKFHFAEDEVEFAGFTITPLPTNSRLQ